ncbi:MAG: ribosome biogenesis GTPase Der [Neisseriaceae bacterium]
MKPTIAIIGRPNVGKSTLFNRLTRTKAALVADQSGLTRDRHYGQGRVGEKPYIVIDTGGFEPIEDKGLLFEMAKQTKQAISEADAVIFLVDVRAGLLSQDIQIAQVLRAQQNSRIYLVVNKAEGMNAEIAKSEFYQLGLLGEPFVISANHGDGVRSLMDEILSSFPSEEEEPYSQHPYFVLVGRPNVGKSSLVNRIIGSERVITFDEAGTTRDSLFIDFKVAEKQYTIIDTAGVRKKGKVKDLIEKYSVIKTLRAIEQSNVVVLVIDASQPVSDQEVTLASFAQTSGKACVVIVNKWDLLVTKLAREQFREELCRKLYFWEYAEFLYVSALKGFKPDIILKAVERAYQSAFKKLSTPKLNRVLQACLEKQSPPEVGGFRPKLRYAHQGGSNPPLVVLHGNSLDKISASYTRYLAKNFIQAFQLKGTPIQIKCISSDNPFNREAAAKPLRRAVLSNRIANREKNKLSRKKKNRVSSKKG